MICGLLMSACFAWPSVSVGQSTATMVVEKATAGTVRQQQWLAATPNERMRLAEAIGDDGARAMAKAKGYDLIYDGSSRTLPQGPDQVYRGKDGRVIVYEAKGGSGQLGHAYGYPQGSTEWAVESAKRVLRSTKASEAEQRAAKEILEAATKGKIDVHVIRTSHVLGEPTAAVLEQSVRCSDQASRLAQAALHNIATAAGTGIDDAARATDDVARAAAEGSTVAKTVSKVALPVAVAVDAGLRVSDGVETEQRFAAGEITSQQREVAHARNASGMAGGWAGAWAGAQLGSVGGGAAGTAVVPGPGTAIGGVVGGVIGGVAGYIGGEMAAEAASDWAVTRVHAAGTTIADSAEMAWKGDRDATHSAVQGFGRAWNWTWGN